jgi:cation transport ATPase
MKATFETNLKCGSCVSKIAPLLDGEATVSSWKTDLQSSKKLLHVELVDDGDPQIVVDLLKQVGFSATPVSSIDSISPSPEVVQLSLRNRHAAESESVKQKLSLATYKPLLIVVAYVIGASTLFELQQASWHWMSWMNYFMGFFFLGFAFFKLLDVAKFADAFTTYDVIAKRSRAYAMAYPFIELTLGILFVTKSWLFVANFATAFVMGIGLIGVIQAVRKKQTIQCACLGTAFNLPMSVVTIIENSVMLVMSLGVLIAALASTNF